MLLQSTNYTSWLTIDLLELLHLLDYKSSSYLHLALCSGHALPISVLDSDSVCLGSLPRQVLG